MTQEVIHEDGAWLPEAELHYHLLHNGERERERVQYTNVYGEQIGRMEKI